MRLPDDVIALILTEASPSLARDIRPSAQQQIASLEATMLADFENHLQPVLVFLEELGHFFLEMERKIRAPVVNDIHRALLVLSARLRSDFIALHQVMLVGQYPSAAILTRSLLETMEIAMAVVGREELAEKYIGDHADSKFWENYIGYGKVYELMKMFYLNAGAPEDEASRSVEQHKSLKSNLSGHVHISSASALLSTFQETVLHPRAFAHGALGTLDPNFSRIVVNLAVETSSFALGLLSTAQNTAGKTAQWLNSNPAALKHLAVSAYVFGELISRHGRAIDEYFHPSTT